MQSSTCPSAQRKTVLRANTSSRDDPRARAKVNGVSAAPQCEVNLKGNGIRQSFEDPMRVKAKVANVKINRERHWSNDAANERNGTTRRTDASTDGRRKCCDHGQA